MCPQGQVLGLEDPREQTPWPWHRHRQSSPWPWPRKSSITEFSFALSCGSLFGE